VAFIGMKDCVLCTKPAAVEVKENVNPPFLCPNLGFSGSNVRDVESR
jgi:hypothetical protein